MQSDFSAQCKAARERICVPAIPLAAIRNAAACPPTSGSTKRWMGPTAAVLACTTLVAAGAAVWNGTHVSFDRSGGFEVRFEKTTSLRNPTFKDLRSFAQRADFPIILPTGLPPGTTIASVHPVRIECAPGPIQSARRLAPVGPRALAHFSKPEDHWRFAEDFAEAV